MKQWRLIVTKIIMSLSYKFPHSPSVKYCFWVKTFSPSKGIKTGYWLHTKLVFYFLIKSQSSIEVLFTCRYMAYSSILVISKIIVLYWTIFGPYFNNQVFFLIKLICIWNYSLNLVRGQKWSNTLNYNID